jgi:hypothetical protein
MRRTNGEFGLQGMASQQALDGPVPREALQRQHIRRAHPVWLCQVERLALPGGYLWGGGS